VFTQGRLSGIFFSSQLETKIWSWNVPPSTSCVRAQSARTLDV